MALRIAMVWGGADLNNSALRNILRQQGHKVTSFTTLPQDFSSFDVVVVGYTHPSAADILAIGKPTVVMFGSVLSGTAAGTWTGMDLTGNITAGNISNFLVVDDTHDLFKGDYPDGSYSISTAARLSNWVASGASFVGSKIIEHPSNGLAMTLAIESGTSFLTSGTTSYRIVLIGQISTINTTAPSGDLYGVIYRSILWAASGYDDIVVDFGSNNKNYDFGSETIGAEPSVGVTKISGPASGVAVRATRIFGNYLAAGSSPQKVVRKEAATGTWIYELDNSVNDTDCDVIARCQLHHTGSPSHCLLYGKGGLYYAEFSNEQTDVSQGRLRVFRSGAVQIGSTTLTASGTFSTDFEHAWVRFQVTDEASVTRIKVKMWQGYISDEPASWMFEQTDATHHGSSGRVRFGFFSTSTTQQVQFDVIKTDLGTPPAAPTVSLSEISATQVRATGSAFSSVEPGAVHISTTYVVRKVSDDSIVINVTVTDPTELTTKLLGPLASSTAYYVEMFYTADIGGNGATGTSANFSTLALDGCAKALIMSAGDGDFIKWGPTPIPWANYSAAGNPLDGKLIAYRFGTIAGQRALLFNCARDSDEGDVTGFGGWDGEFAAQYYAFYGFPWARYWSIEWSGIGACCLVNGDYGTPYSGFFIWLAIGIPGPYGSCATIGGTYPGTNYIHYYIVEQGKIVGTNAIPVPDTLFAVNRACGNFGRYGFWLKYTKDYVGDPTGRTWRFRFAWETGALPDGMTWDVDITHQSEVFTCGKAGPAVNLLPGATGGSSGAVYLDTWIVQNTGEFCETGDETIPTVDTPAIVANANCGFIHATVVGAWGGPTFGPATEAKWDFRLNSDSSLLYSTGFQSDQILDITINLFDHPEIPQNTAIDVEVTLRDAALNESSTSAAVTVTTGQPPNPPTVDIVAFFANVVILEVGEFSSPDPSATHFQTSIGAFLASDTTFSNPVALTTFTTPEQLTGQFRLEYQFTVNENYRFRVIFTDQNGCTSTALTEAMLEEPIIAPATVCPEWEACDLGTTASWVPCTFPTASAWVKETTPVANWDTDCADPPC